MAKHPLRILQISTERGWRGGERQTLLTALGLRDQGHQVELLLRPGSALAQRAAEQGLVVHTADAAVSFGWWLAAKGKGYDVLHAQSAQAVGWAAATTVLHGRPLVFTRRTSFSTRAGWLTRLKWQRVSQMVAISEAAAQAPRAMGILTQVIPSAVLPCRVDAQRVDSFLQKRQLEGRRLVGTAAALSLEKDPITLVRAAALVCAQFPDVVFVHWGAAGNAVEQTRQLIDEYGLQGRYLLLGFEAEVEQLFTALSVFVMASRCEALGSTVLDAMLQKIPVVSTDAGGLKETVGQGRGLLCAPGDFTAMATQIGELLAQPARAQAMAEAAYTQVRAAYDVNDMVVRYVGVYEAAMRTVAP